jgi:hypothetical protein
MSRLMIRQAYLAVKYPRLDIYTLAVHIAVWTLARTEAPLGEA